MTTSATLDKPLSRRQRDVYDYVRMFIEDNGYSPTIREIADGIMLSSASTVHSHVNSLIRKGYLTHSSGGVRTLALTKKGKRPKVVTQAGIMRWIQDQGIEKTHDANVYNLLADLQESIQSGEDLLMIDYRKVKTVVWTPEQIANHLKAIGAEHPPKPPDKLQKAVTAPQQHNGNSRYYKRGGEW